ncbi:patatin-like phospholipase family protein [Sulfuriroseicoccus oceanibius]|uniref:Patatin-like phospholipase family protein n=1 Tax=Sulfuriroseicoccus oceanibius TaxID=2707525 RepID=A0A6B3L125_9BACT|nr:patatin-like phospholipase family protein [Sulfuriroseicoccus oceanibius]QQL44154.1 patatin-like phospholipase family protein [Sulfuriroseicoccus oceanibius]
MQANGSSWLMRREGTGGESGGGRGEGTRPKVGLALSSGCARGLADVGVIAVLEQAGVKIDAVAGTSMGAYIGALFAAGYRSEQMELMARRIKTIDVVLGVLDVELPPVKGLLKGQKVEDVFRRELKSLHFEDLRLPLYVVAANLETLERVVFSQGPVLQAVRASCSIPGVMCPYEYGGVRYVDGAVVDPLPVSILRHTEGCDIVLAVNTIPTVGDLGASAMVDRDPDAKQSRIEQLGRWLGQWANLAAPGNIGDTLSRSVLALQIRLADKASRKADVCMHLKETGNHWHDYHNHQHYIEHGRAIAEAKIDEVKRVIAEWQPAATARKQDDERDEL